MSKSIVVCFLGPDGSGKSSLSREVSYELKKRGYKVLHIWWLEGENTTIRKIIRRIVTSKQPPSITLREKTSKSKKGTPTAFLYKWLYPRIVLLEYLRFGITKLLIPKLTKKYDFILLDRYIYDVILALSKEFGLSFKNMARLIKILPSPDIVFFVEVSPETAYSRKKEELKSIENTREIFKNYQQLYSILPALTTGKIIKINNEGPLIDSKNKILEELSKHLESIRNQEEVKI